MIALELEQVLGVVPRRCELFSMHKERIGDADGLTRRRFVNGAGSVALLAGAALLIGPAAALVGARR